MIDHEVGGGKKGRAKDGDVVGVRRLYSGGTSWELGMVVVRPEEIWKLMSPGLLVSCLVNS